ncbi:MAG: M23 family metallopeptidase, partial [Prevotellaceae bacterium]|nr:M23 family metallopeptidase [Prevotellaceae bacterium]
MKPSFGNTDYSYKTKYLWGCKDSAVQLDYPYLLPIASGKETTIKGLYNFSEKYEIKKVGVPTRDYYALLFKTESGDTIYASRRGSVFRVKDDADLKHENYSMSSDDNELYVAHLDCSIARYRVLNQIFVREGDWVGAGQPIAITGGEKYISGTHVRISVYYAYKCLDCGGDNEGRYGYAYVKPKFYL